MIFMHAIEVAISFYERTYVPRFLQTNIAIIHDLDQLLALYCSGSSRELHLLNLQTPFITSNCKHYNVLSVPVLFVVKKSVFSLR